jgi:6,7-dimethyl-8-ribityllumazine synthase
MTLPVLIVVAPYYQEITDQLIAGATTALRECGYSHEIVTVPGAFEIPAAIRFAQHSRRYAGYIALGCVVRGETSHYDYVCGESARGLQDLALQHSLAIGYGILTVENMEQAEIRADIEEGNKGGEAALACVRMIELQLMYGVNA